jgi:hypothetical protein
VTGMSSQGVVESISSCLAAAVSLLLGVFSSSHPSSLSTALCLCENCCFVSPHRPFFFFFLLHRPVTRGRELPVSALPPPTSSLPLPAPSCDFVTVRSGFRFGLLEPIYLSDPCKRRPTGSRYRHCHCAKGPSGANKASRRCAWFSLDRDCSRFDRVRHTLRPVSYCFVCVRRKELLQDSATR